MAAASDMAMEHHKTTICPLKNTDNLLFLAGACASAPSGGALAVVVILITESSPRPLLLLGPRFVNVEAEAGRWLCVLGTNNQFSFVNSPLVWHKYAAMVGQVLFLQIELIVVVFLVLVVASSWHWIMETCGSELGGGLWDDAG